MCCLTGIGGSDLTVKAYQMPYVLSRDTYHEDPQFIRTKRKTASKSWGLGIVSITAGHSNDPKGRMIRKGWRRHCYGEFGRGGMELRRVFEQKQIPRPPNVPYAKGTEVPLAEVGASE
jgi:hypothetical protein